MGETPKKVRRRRPYWVGWLISDVLASLGENEDGLGYWLDQLELAVQNRNWYAVSLALANAGKARHRLKAKVLEYQMESKPQNGGKETDRQQEGEEYNE